MFCAQSYAWTWCVYSITGAQLLTHTQNDNANPTARPATRMQVHHQMMCLKECARSDVCTCTHTHARSTMPSFSRPNMEHTHATIACIACTSMQGNARQPSRPTRTNCKWHLRQWSPGVHAYPGSPFHRGAECTLRPYEMACRAPSVEHTLRVLAPLCPCYLVQMVFRDDLCQFCSLPCVHAGELTELVRLADPTAEPNGSAQAYCLIFLLSRPWIAENKTIRSENLMYGPTTAKPVSKRTTNERKRYMNRKELGR